MDPITTAIVAALANLSKDVVKDSYSALKTALKNKFGGSSDLVDAVKGLEKKPDSDARKAMVQEEIETAKVTEDGEILQLAQELLDKLQDQPGAQQVITQNITNVKYAATSGSGNASISGINEHGIPEDK